MKPTNTRVVVSGSSWMGSGLGSVESALFRLFEQANEEVSITAYAISSGATVLFEQIAATLLRGVRVRLVINRFVSQPAETQKALRQLQRDFAPLFQLLSFDAESDQADLHAKVVIVDRQQALVGSANFSLRGLVSNHELGVIVSGMAAAEIARAVDLLLASSSTSPVGPPTSSRK